MFTQTSIAELIHDAIATQQITIQCYYPYSD